MADIFFKYLWNCWK